MRREKRGEKRRKGQNSARSGHWRGGFTLLELLAVLAIIGFLLAMVAPRMAAVTTTAAEVTTETNMSRLLNYLTDNLQQSGNYPDGLINIVSVDRNGGYHKPQVADGDPERPEVLATAMDTRHRLHIHYLNREEAEELRRLGVVRLYSYNSPNDRNVYGDGDQPIGHAPHMEQVDAGVAVLMTGGGMDEHGSFIVDTGHESDRAHPDQLFRVLFGLGAESSLLKKGTIMNAALHPRSTQKPVNHDWQYYSILVPRLEATAKRLRSLTPSFLPGASGEKGELDAYGIFGAASADSGTLQQARKRRVAVFERQHHSFFEVMDALGNTRPGPDMHGWGIDFNGDGNIE